jgi:S-(hydroxymethyl)glutathione dehydrogenase / alcohol dehydrogenase
LKMRAAVLEEFGKPRLAIRDQQNKGYLPDGTTRLSRDGEPIRHFMGTSTFAEYTVMPEIALAKVSPDAAPDHACLFACGSPPGWAPR